jgi:hypothetical protein
MRFGVVSERVKILKTHRQSRGIAPLILKLSTAWGGHIHDPAALPTVSTAEEAALAHCQAGLSFILLEKYLLPLLGTVPWFTELLGVTVTLFWRNISCPCWELYPGSMSY